MNDTYPPFETAVEQFQAFLASQRWPTQINWIRPGDVLRNRERLVVRVAPSAECENHAKSVFARGVAARLGVLLDAVCTDSQFTFARVVRPLDARASELQLFPDGLKLSVPGTPTNATRIGLRLRWWLWTKISIEWPGPDPDTET
jgi:hypothetical protein